MGHFSGIGETELYTQGTYLSPGGMYELEVQNMLVKKTRKSGLGFIVEFKVLSASGEGGEKHAPGSSATWFQKMQDEDIAFPSIKRFFVALENIDMNDPEAKEDFNNNVETLLDEATSWQPEDQDDEHPWKGARVMCETYTKITKVKKQEFTQHNWSAAEDAE